MKSKEEIIKKAQELIKENKFETYFSIKIVEPEKVKEELENKLKICSNRSERLIKVEEIKFQNEVYSIFIFIPGKKSECDFFVIRFDNTSDQILKIPSHDDLANTYLSLKNRHEILEEYLINSVLRFLNNRKDENEIIKNYFSELNEELIFEVKKFFITLKWIAFQEDVNYPQPKYLGSKYTLSIFALLECGFKINEIRRILRFKI
ncbi:MAG: hypothetical protein QXQ14_01150 [Candidatus Aenigmatarchaeota archaeon]